MSFLKGRSGYFSKKKAAEFLLRCTEQLETPETWKNRIYAVNIGLQRIVDEDEDAAPECLFFELFPGCSAKDVEEFVKNSARSGDELSKVLDLPKTAEPVIAIHYSSDNFEDPTEDLWLYPNARAIVTETGTIVYTMVGCASA